MTPFNCYFYYFGILLENRAHFSHRNHKFPLGNILQHCHEIPGHPDFRLPINVSQWKEDDPAILA